MSRKDTSQKPDRRQFLTGVVAAGAASAIAPQLAHAAEAAKPRARGL